MRPCSVVCYLATLFTFGRQSLGLKPGLFNGRDGFLLSKANFQTLKDQQKTYFCLYFCNLQNICPEGLQCLLEEYHEVPEAMKPITIYEKIWHV